MPRPSIRDFELNPGQRDQLNAALGTIQDVFGGSLVGFVVFTGEEARLALNPRMPASEALDLMRWVVLRSVPHRSKRR